MGMFDRLINPEKRSFENPNAPVSANDFLHIMGWGDFSSAAGVTVNTDNALGVPAVWAAVNFISGTLTRIVKRFISRVISSSPLLYTRSLKIGSMRRITRVG